MTPTAEEKTPIQLEQYQKKAISISRQVIDLREELETQVNQPSDNVNELRARLALLNSADGIINKGMEVKVTEPSDEINKLLSLEGTLLQSAADYLGQSLEQLPRLVIVEVPFSPTQNCQICLSNSFSSEPIGPGKRSPKTIKLTADNVEEPLKSYPIIF